MKTCGVWLLSTVVCVLVAGCTSSPSDPAARKSEAAKVQAALEKLDPEDRKLAEAQKFCAVQNKNLLGSMGKPFKLVLKKQTVFLCCDGCKETAESDPEKTLATAEELRSRSGAPH
jgi:hypothetical protein